MNDVDRYKRERGEQLRRFYSTRRETPQERARREARQTATQARLTPENARAALPLIRFATC